MHLKNSLNKVEIHSGVKERKAFLSMQNWGKYLGASLVITIQHIHDIGAKISFPRTLYRRHTLKNIHTFICRMFLI